MTCIVAILPLLISVCLADIYLNVEGDTRRAIDLGEFAFGDVGKAEFHVTHFLAYPAAFTNGKVNDSLGFVLDRVPSVQLARGKKNWARTEGAEQRTCFIAAKEMLPNEGERHLFSFSGKTIGEIQSTPFSADIKVPGLYALFYYNCIGFDIPKDQELPVIPVTFEVRAVLYNVNERGEKNYLSYGDRYLPAVFGIFALVFLVMAIVWGKLLRDNAKYAHKIHSLMLFLVVVKALSLGFESAKFAHYGSTGHPSVWDVFYYILLTVKGVALFTVLLLLGSGWSIMKAFLSDRDKKILIVVLTSQVFVNIALAMIEETSEGSTSWSQWHDLLEILDIVCCCCVLLPIVWSMKGLREAAQQDEKAARTIARMHRFRSFYIVIVAYIYSTRIAVDMIENSLPYQSTWIAKVIRECVAVAFYLYTGSKFQPAAENPYLHVERDDAEELATRDEVTARV